MQSPSSLWVELFFQGRASFVELQEGGRPLGIGSGWCADLRISDAKVAVVHCEIVFDERVVCLRPTGHADVRLNAAHVGAGVALPERSLVEFLGHEIEVRLHIQRPPRPSEKRKKKTQLGYGEPELFGFPG